MKKLTVMAAVLFSALTALAQTRIDVQVPNLVSLDEQFNVTFVIEGDAPSDFRWSEGDDFQLVWGPRKAA